MISTFEQVECKIVLQLILAHPVSKFKYIPSRKLSGFEITVNAPKGEAEKMIRSKGNSAFAAEMSSLHCLPGLLALLTLVAFVILPTKFLSVNFKHFSDVGCVHVFIEQI